ncbi:MAG: CRISPR-associated helicase Cas3' [Terrisporobacter sp.]
MLDKYKAKSDNTSIKQHNDELLKIKEQIKDIYSISDSMSESLDKCIEYHDIGKVVDSYQNSIESLYRTIRHEILSASAKVLTDNEKLAIITHHKEIKELIKYVENEYYEDEVNEMSEKLGIEVEDIRGFIKKLNRILNSITKDLDNILLKGYLQYCDHLASAGVDNIEKGFNSISSFKFDNYNSIQRQVLNIKDKEDILLIAPTGLGKTSTSLFWSNLYQNKDKSKRIYYLLPYTASINSLYKDISKKGISTSMLHSRVEYFLDKLQIENTKEMKNLFRKSVKQLNISTIYQIIKAIFSCKRYEMILAQLKDSIFIVDEIHCFDVDQLALLLTTLKFLKNKLNISICIMSASIPTSMQHFIQEELNISKVIKASSDDYKVRHKVNRINKELLLDIDKIKNDLDNNKQILICVNSVDLSQKLYQELSEYNPKLLHGRFNTRDREKSEKDIGDCKLLIGTQAIEVSLDISYDVMYTEIAPFDSLQQRFGRINRRGEKGISDIFIYNKTSKVYDEQIIINTDEAIKEIIEIDKSIVLEEKTQYYLDKVYVNFDIDKYNDISERVEKVISSLRVATFNKNATDDMCSFGTISVLPHCLLNEYIELIENKKYLQANSLFVNVYKYKMRYIDKISICNDDVYIINCKYDERGLVFEECRENIFM